MATRATVDLPEPLEPSNATTPPAGTANVTSNRARYGPYAALTCVDLEGRCSVGGEHAPRRVLEAGGAHAEVPRYGVPHLGVRHHLVERAVGDHLAEVHHDRPVDAVADHPEIVLDEQDRHAPLVLQGAKHLGQLTGLVDVEARRGLVGHQELGLAHERPGQLHQPAHPEAEGGDGRVRLVGEPDQFEHFVHARPARQASERSG